MTWTVTSGRCEGRGELLSWGRNESFLRTRFRRPLAPPRSWFLRPRHRDARPRHWRECRDLLDLPLDHPEPAALRTPGRARRLQRGQLRESPDDAGAVG